MSDTSNEQPLPDRKNYLVFCDESGISGKRYYGFGSLWMPWERRGSFEGLIGDLVDRHRFQGEIKWTKVKGAALPFMRELVVEFFRRNWLMFHCVLVRKGYTDRSFHKDFDEEKRKRFAMLLKSKVRYFSGGDSGKAYHIRVDPLPSRYAKADEAAHKIVNHTLKRDMGIPAIASLVTKDSKATRGIQVADLLLGAVVAAFQQEAEAQPKLKLMAHIADHLGWPDLHADTQPEEWKFNVWYFHDPKSGGPREIQTRPVKLKIRMPPFRPRRPGRR